MAAVVDMVVVKMIMTMAVVVTMRMAGVAVLVVAMTVAE